MQSMKRKKNMFVHFILDPISISETATEASFAARYGCLVIIENVSIFSREISCFYVVVVDLEKRFLSSEMDTFQVERLEIGALVSIRGAGRVKISRFLGVKTLKQTSIFFVSFGLTRTLGTLI